MSTSVMIRFACIALLWIALCWLVVSSRPFTAEVAFWILASAIIVWVPLYKKYLRNEKRKDEQ
ncbi:MAG: hypothetical protein K2K55_04110 [Duncaniella sp.]|nr:hypothetical protein [Duncaniella sp.]